MHWLQIGASKSGNLWLYHILQSVIRHAGIPQKNFIKTQPIYQVAKDWDLGFKGQADIDTLTINPSKCLYRISGVFNMPIQDINAYIGATSHVWTQSLPSEMTRKVLPKFQKKIYILRDPRDRLLSLARYHFTPYRLKYFGKEFPDEASCVQAVLPEVVFHWVQHVSGYLLDRNALDVHFIIYERLLFDFDTEMTRLLEYLDIPPSAELLAKVKQDVRFDSMKSTNPQHVREGSTGEWTERLSAAQIKTADAIAAPLLRLLHYPITAKEFKKEPFKNLPRVPDPLRAEDLKRALRHADRWALIDKVRRKVRRAFP